MNEEDQVKKILNNLPKAPPMTEFELKKFEKFIDLKISELKTTTQPANRFRNFSVAAAIVLVVGGGALFVNQGKNVVKNSVIQHPTQEPTNQVVSPSTPAISATPSPKQNPRKSDSEQLLSNGEKNSPKAGLYKTGLDYETQLSDAINKVTKPDKNVLDSVSKKIRNCAISQGIVKSTVAFDYGTYQGEPIYAFYTGKLNPPTEIVITDESCVEVARINP
jgi:hypothetical protein